MSYDAELEREIDLAGRDEVFARARQLGWNWPDSPPAYVWWSIVADVYAERVRLLTRGGSQ